MERRSRYFEIAEEKAKSEEDRRLIKLSQPCLQNDPRSRPNTKIVLEELLHIEQSQGPSKIAEIWKKDKLELVMILEEKQREFDEQQQQKLYSVSRSVANNNGIYVHVVEQLKLIVWLWFWVPLCRLKNACNWQFMI